MIKPWAHQISIAKEAVEIIKQHMIVYLAMEERTGKSLTALLVAEDLEVKDVLIITKKKALTDWKQLLKDAKLTKSYQLVNYHQAWKLIGQYDLVLLDESHNYLSSYPKIGATAAQLKKMRKKGQPNKSIYGAVKRLTKRVPIIYISATPYAQGPQLLFHQFALSSWSPWHMYSNFYNWFRTYGRPYTISIRLYGKEREVTQYDKCKAETVVEMSKHLFITKTRAELDFEHEPIDVIHHISLSDDTRRLYNELIKDKLVFLDSFHEPLVCDILAKLRSALHMLEGGVAKIDTVENERIKPNYVVLNNTEKVDFILDKFGDSKDLVIMYNYKAEKIKLEDHFRNASILQATSYAEGVDLSMFKDLVVYSQDFSTARHTQRRARQCNLHRKEPIKVHFLLVKKAISEQVYKTVSVNKRNFVDSVFIREEL